MAIRDFLCFALLCAPAVTGAQLRGTVISAETREPLGLTIVTLHPGLGTQFADAGGTFSFATVGAGTYLLSVRQIGYVPLDTPIVVSADTGIRVQVALRHLAIELPPVTALADWCTHPGAPDSSDTTLLAVFGQLQENARRYELLAERYPFQYVLELSERTLYSPGDTGKPYVRQLRFSSSDRRPYEVGKVVAPAWGPWGNPATTVVIRSAELEDLGNPAFIEHHCFRLAGLDTLGGESFVRIDFEPDKSLGADMAGSAYLDPITYAVRYTMTALTRPERSVLMDVRSMNFVTRFREIAPGVPLQDSLTAVTTYRHGRRTKVETQRTLDIRFRREAPK
jgi:hypothetical protein